MKQPIELEGGRMIVRLLFILGAFIGAGGCSMKPNPGVALQDVDFAERPHILKRGDSYYLRYRIATKHGTVPPLRMVLCSRKGQDKGYYYFSVPISHPEPGYVVERALADDQLTDFARRNAVYWLNPDGSEIQLELEEAS